ncbi:MAG: ribbon-helix-helix domain-containing protein [Acidobacteria bacterium]|nr:ribbon-helix-helix domain-containing protein [Acidobacteriota bacterium]
MKQAKTKVGRPRLPKGQALGKPTPIRFQDDERAAFERAAKKEGLTLSEWIRQTLKEATQK